MVNSQDADLLLREIRSLREERQRRFERDLHFIDAEYDRRVRRLRSGEHSKQPPWARSMDPPLCLRRRCLLGMRRFKRRLKSRCSA